MVLVCFGMRRGSWEGLLLLPLGSSFAAAISLELKRLASDISHFILSCLSLDFHFESGSLDLLISRITLVGPFLCIKSQQLKINYFIMYSPLLKYYSGRSRANRYIYHFLKHVNNFWEKLQIRTVILRGEGVFVFLSRTPNLVDGGSI